MELNLPVRSEIVAGEESRVGDVLASKYRLEELLGSGGMGHVYRAVNVEIERAVAIKVLRNEHSANTALVERFLREARAANLVRHPNVVDVVDIGREDGGSPFIVQELLSGEDLSKFVERRGGKLTLSDINEYILPVIEALAEAHAKGVVHRDIKPENVFLADQGKRKIPKLLDFGISKLREPNIKQTEVGVMMGTPAYMAPEQIQGARDADPRSDVWALGIMLFELLAGRLPFEADDAPAFFYAVATQDVPPLTTVAPEIPGIVSGIVAKCLRRDAEERYPTANELALDLRRFFEGAELDETITREIDIPKGASIGKLSIADLSVPSRRLEPIVAAKSPAARLEAEAASSADAPALDLAERFGPPRTSLHPKNVSLSGVIVATPSSAPRRTTPVQSAHVRPPAPLAGPETSLLVGIGVVAIITIVEIAGLATFAGRPEGWPLVSYVTKPTATANLVIHGGLGLACIVLAGRSAALGVKKWSGTVAGGRGAAVVSAIVAGGLFFAALQLARAAW